MRRSIRKQIAFTFVGLLLLVLVSNYLINNFFLEDFYVLQKQRALIRVYRLMNSYEDPISYQKEEFQDNISYICGSNNIRFVISDKNLKPQLWYTTSNQESELLAGRLFAYVYRIDSLEKEILVDKDGYTIQKMREPSTKQEYLEIWGVLDNGYSYIMRVAVASIQDSVKISNEFFAYFVIAGLVMGSILVIWISKRITKPIQELTELSRKMSELDFEAKYTRGGEDEIAQLGDHFNQMSQKLESAISELKTANNELQQDIEKKEEIDEMRKEFLANVSHELKTPIALIQGYAEGLKECINDDPESRDFYCEVIMDEANKMNQMVRKLLTLNQLEFGNEVVNFERFDLVKLVNGIVQSSSILAQQKGAAVRMKTRESVFVWADEFKIEEVVTNYISNAFHHLAGDKIIEIKIEPLPNGIVRTSVFNTGNPIPEEELEKIWVKFYKVDKARTREYGGSGIGLSIVKAIMDSHHQSCGVNNWKNGVEFWFELDGGTEQSHQ